MLLSTYGTEKLLAQIPQNINIYIYTYMFVYIYIMLFYVFRGYYKRLEFYLVARQNFETLTIVMYLDLSFH